MKKPDYSPQVGMIRAFLLGVFLTLAVSYVALVVMLGGPG